MLRLHVVAALLLIMLLAACSSSRSGAGRGQGDFAFPMGGEAQSGASASAASTASEMPSFVIPMPTLPPGLCDPGEASGPPVSVAEGLRYKVSFECKAAPELLALLKGASLLERLQDDLPDGITGLERRLRADEATAQRVMRAYGYYAGTVDGRVDASVEPAQVKLVLTPGPRFTIGQTTVSYSGGPVPDWAPLTLEPVGLATGAPAVTKDVLAAVQRLPRELQDKGYPYAQIKSTRYIADLSTQTLDATIDVSPGALVHMGPLVVNGAQGVNHAYLDTFVNWKDGDVWDEARVDAFREALRQTGLFTGIEVGPASKPDAAGQRPIVADLVTGPTHSYGGGVRYETALGPGVTAFWEDRNIASEGETLRFDLPLWQDRQELDVSFRKPFIGRADQDFVAEGWVRNETSDAYDLQAASASAGLERRLSPHWWTSIFLSGEGGQQNDFQNPVRNYFMAGVPWVVRHDSTNDPINPTRGMRGQFKGGPYTGYLDEVLSFVKAQFTISGYYPVLHDKVVLAARVAAGALEGATTTSIPSSFRFYSGGGGSVRGYDYQSLGPQDNGTPLGGTSLGELSLEARIRITETIGIVPFLDGGMVYAESLPPFGKDMRWGAGLGLRYFTPVGPVRLDVATPLNPRENDANLHFYLSIGQSF